MNRAKPHGDPGCRFRSHSQYNASADVYGFTLIELIVTVFVAAILATLVVPNMMTFVLNNRLTTQINDIAADFVLARSEAIKRGTIITVVAADGTDDGNEWGGGWRIVTPDGTNLRSAGPLSGGNRLDSMDDRTAIQYLPGGFISGTSSLRFKLCDDRSGATGKELTIELSGRITVRSQITCP